MSDNPTKKPDNQANEPAPEANPKLFAGKYRSVEDLEKGYWELSKEGLKQRDARVRAEAERDALMNQLQHPPRDQGKDPLVEAFSEAAIPIEALDARVEAKALGILQNVLQPMMKQQTAEQSMVEKHKDWPGTMEIFKGLDPEAAESYRKLLTTDPEAAMELGYRAWKAEQAPMTAIDETSKRTASSPPKRAGDAGAAEPENDRKLYQELLQEAVQTGDWRKFGRYRFKDTNWFKRITEGEDW